VFGNGECQNGSWASDEDLELHHTWNYCDMCEGRAAAGLTRTPVKIGKNEVGTSYDISAAQRSPSDSGTVLQEN